MAKKKTYTKREQEEESFILPKALLEYLNRIGAEVLSFRRAMVKERSKGDKYYVERTLIKIAANGEITCSRKEHEPTTAEEEAIVEAFKNLNFPTSTNGTIQSAQKHIRDMEGDPDRFFILPDRQSGDVRMLQERIETRDGRKGYIPWSFWSDGRWRKMEPDGHLPFWKPLSRVEGRTRIMVHEGCKAARAVHDLTTNPDKKKELAKHPWGEELCDYEHWGMIGGALAPHRTEYDEIRREKPHKVVYVCDNDYEGKSVLQEVSKHYGQSLTGIKFNTDFPPSWDMADAMPKILFNGERYTGQSLFDLMRPATYATELVPPAGGKGRPMAVIRRAFKEEWIHSVTPKVFVHTGWPERILLPDEFNNMVRPFSHVDETSRLLLQDDSNKTAILSYDPGKKPGIYSSGSGDFINTHVPTRIKAEQGDITPFTDFMEQLCPVAGDRIELERWCATLIARLDIKMHYGALLISETQGVGKSTLGEKVLAPLVGDVNVSFPSEDTICSSNYNYWIAHKRLAVVHEIYAGHSAVAYNRLKDVITDKNLTVNRKYMAPYDIDNWIHVFACSNSKRAVQLSSDDRRWLVPKLTEEKRKQAYWEKFHGWLRFDGGLNKIKWWAHKFLEKNEPVRTGTDAPWTAAKDAVIEEGYSPGQALVSQVFEYIGNEMEKPQNERAKIGNATQYRTNVIDENCFVLDCDMVDLIRNMIHQGRPSDKLEKPATVRKVAKQKGWIVNENRISTVLNWNIRAAGAKLVCKNPAIAAQQIGQLSQAGMKPLNVLDFHSGKM